MSGYTVTPSVTLNPLAMLADPDVRATPSPADRKQSAMLQAVLSYDGAAGSGGGSWYGGGWGGNRYEQVNHYRGVVAIAINAWLRALSACKYTLLRKKSKSIKKSTGGLGNYARDDDYEPVSADEHPLAKVLECPGGEDGHWSIHQECTYLTLQYLLTGDAPAWTPCNAAGKPVRFYALVSALTRQLYPPGVNPQYPKGAYRVTPYGASGFAVGGQLGSFAILPGEEVARLRAPHPWSRGLGMSPLQVGDREIDVLEAITQSRWAMFDHGVQLDAALLMPGLDAEAGKALREQIEAGHGGARHARRFLVLSGAGLDMKWDLKTFGQSSREMDYNTSFDQAAGLALALFGVPKQNVNFNSESNYAQDWAGQQKFYDLTLAPYARGQLSDFLTQSLARRWEKTRGELKIEVEPAIPKNLEMEAKSRDTGLQTGASDVNEWRIANGLKPKPDGGVPLPVYLAKLQQQFAPQPDPMAAMGGDDQGGGFGAPGGAEDPDSQGLGNADQDGPEATQDAVAQAALQALGLGGQTQRKAFDPNEARDDHGRWARWAGGAVGEHLPKVKKVGTVHDGKRQVTEVTFANGQSIRFTEKMNRESATRQALDRLAEQEGHTVHDPDERSERLARARERFAHTSKGGVGAMEETLARIYSRAATLTEAMRLVRRDISENNWDRPLVRDYIETEMRALYAEQKALGPVKTPGAVGRVVRREGEVWAGRDGKRYTKKNGQIVPAPQQGQQRPTSPTGAPTRPQAQPADPRQAAANLDALAKRLLGGRPAARMLVSGGGPSLPAKEHVVTDGASLRRYLDAGGKLHPEHFAEPARSVPAQTPQAKQVLQTVGQWAASHADRHADRVAQHFGISRDKAHALLVHAMTMVAKHAAKNSGDVRGVTIRDPKSGKTARLAPKQGQGQGVPRPANPGAAGSRPPVAKAFDPDQMRDDHGRWARAQAERAEIADLEGKLADHHHARADELDALADEAERRIAEELAAGTPESDSLVRFGRSQVALLRRFARERRELAAGGRPDAGWLDDIDRGEAKAVKGLRKAMSSLVGSAGGFLVEPGQPGRRRKGGRAAAVAARVLARLEGQG